MRSLLVAAGGGGDAVGAIMARRLIAPDMNGPLLIATYAWERVRVDPEPGPRPPGKFSHLRAVGPCAVEIDRYSETVPPGRSTLPRLAADTGARLFVLDAGQGAVGMRHELGVLIRELHVQRVVVVDVGGDAVARGTESELLSPLADALALAACVDLQVPVQVSVVGPGVDGELPESLVLSYLRELGASLAGTIARSDSDPLSAVLRWHPTEATSIVAAASHGVRGLVELRRGSISTALTDHSAEVWLAELTAVAQHNLLISPLAHSQSLIDAERILGRWATSELIRERQRALAFQQRAHVAAVVVDQLLADLVAYSREAHERGITLITTRRLAEASGHPDLDMSIITDALNTSCSSSQRGGLWHVPTLAAVPT